MTEGNMQGEGEPIEAQTVEQRGGEQTEDLEAKFQKMLDEAKAKWEKDLIERLEKERKEQQRLSTLSDEEKKQAMIEAREAELAEKERQLLMRSLELDTIKILDEEKLPVKFAKFLIGEDSESTLENIKTFKTEWRNALNAAVDKRLGGRTPTASTAGEGKREMDILGLAREANIRNK